MHLHTLLQGGRGFPVLGSSSISLHIIASQFCLLYIYNLKQLLPADTPLKAYVFKYTEAQFQASSFPSLHLSDLNNASAY